MSKDSSDDEDSHEVDDKIDKMNEKMPASVQEQSLTSSSSGDVSDINAKGIMYANLSTSEVQDLIDKEVLGFSKPWKGKIPFHLRVVNYGMDDTSIHKQPLQLLDICDYLDGQDSKCKRLYFSIEKYPPPSNDIDMKATDESGNTNCAGFNSLMFDLKLAAENAGSPIVMNGGGTDKDDGREQRRRASCAHCYRRKRKSRAMPITAANPLKKTSLVNDRQNNRGPKGIFLPKRVKQTKKNVICKLQFTIKWDEYGFYVELFRSSGCPLHNDHPRPLDISAIPFPTRLLTQQQREDTCQVVAATSNKATGRNFALNNYGRFISSMKVAYIQAKLNHEGGATSKEDDICRMLQEFKKSNDIKFTTLSDIPVEDLEGYDGGGNETVTVSTTKNDDGTITSTPVSEMLGLSSLNLEETAKRERRERIISRSDVMFMSVAWIKRRNFRLFKLCPEVIWCDVTSHSNNKGFHLLTFSCRLSVNKQVVFLWIWIPNQQRSSFRWVFQHVLPILIPRFHRYRVKMIMKDGDPQQRNEILISLRNSETEDT